jgi:methyl-accepting chemotaxis protein
MLKAETTEKPSEKILTGSPDLYANNGLENELDSYKENAIRRIHFSIILKPAIISFVALILSFFLDLSYVPILGNVSVDLGKALFPTWQPAEQIVEPFSFWWLPVVVYALFIFMAFLAYNKLKLEVLRSPASETIDRIITSYQSVIDSISTALPLIGAAILLISIKLGEEIFLGLSVPFEIKALIVLALGKLFEPVLDQLGVEFQNVVTHVQDMKERYFSRIQIENSRNLVKQLSQPGAGGKGIEISAKDLEAYKTLLERTTELSETLVTNFSSVHEILDKINNIQGISPEKIEHLKSLAASIQQASITLGDEKTQAGLKHLEAIVVKK